MKTLNELDLLEQEIYTEIQGRAKIKNADLDSEDKFLLVCARKYKDIHDNYVHLIKNSDKQIQIEALKRALFIQWLGSFEPSCNTGITLSVETAETPDNSSGIGLTEVSFVYEYLDNLITKKSLDDELFEMLSYYSCWEFVFEFFHFKGFRSLHNFVVNVADKNKPWPYLIKKRGLINRGKMGIYFLSLYVMGENTSR